MEPPFRTGLPTRWGKGCRRSNLQKEKELAKDQTASESVRHYGLT